MGVRRNLKNKKGCAATPKKKWKTTAPLQYLHAEHVTSMES